MSNDAMLAEEQRTFDRREQAVNGVARAMCAAFHRGSLSNDPEGMAKETAITRYAEASWTNWIFTARQLLARVDCPQVDTEAAALADRLEEQDCLADAELVRRLAGL